MDNLFTPFIGSLVRHLMTYVGGYLTAIGVAESVATQWVSTTSELVAGLILTVIGGSWSLWIKKK